MNLYPSPNIINNVEDVTASRTVLTEYTNNTKRNLFVSISARCLITGAGSYSVHYIEEDAGAGYIASAIAGAEDSPVTTLYTTITAIIKPNSKYRWVTSSGTGSVAIIKWVESS